MPDIKLLVLEDHDAYVENNYRSPARDYARRDGFNIELDVVSTKDDALSRLKHGRYDGAILDLRLAQGADEAEGNAVAKEIHSHYLMPVAIVTAFDNELAPELRTMAERPASLLKCFNKAHDGSVVFNFFIRIDRSQVLQIFRPGGEFNKILTNVLWDHLAKVVERLHEHAPNEQMRRRVLRHAVYHVLAFLQRDGNCENWDDYLSEEVYIVPCVGSKNCTGEILAEPVQGGGSGAHVFLVTPACDVEKIARALIPAAAGAAPGAPKPAPFYQVVRILPLTAASRIDKQTLKEVWKKTNTRYHLLPPSDTYPGGIIDFWQLQNVPAPQLATYQRVAQVTDPFTKDIVARLGAWISRQGSPEFHEDMTEQIWSKIIPAAPAAPAPAQPAAPKAL